MKENELYRDTLWVGVQTDTGIYRFGTISFLIEVGGRNIYEYDFDEERYYEALRLSGERMFPGFEPTRGFKQRHDKEISFIYERTFSPRRPDLAEMLKPWDMEVSEYSKWGLLKKTRGVHWDKWRCTPYFEETY